MRIYFDELFRRRCIHIDARMRRHSLIIRRCVTASSEIPIGDLSARFGRDKNTKKKRKKERKRATSIIGERGTWIPGGFSVWPNLLASRALRLQLSRGHCSTETRLVAKDRRQI